MSLQDQIEKLEQQQANEIRNLRYLFSRSNRQIRHTLSPDRVIRKNLGISFIVAALLGMFLAPGPKYLRATKDGEVKKSKGRSLFMRLGRALVPMLGLAGHAKSKESAPPADEKKKSEKRGLIEIALAEFLSVAVKKIDWKNLSSQLATLFGRGTKKSQDEYTPPAVSVADVGTQRADEPISTAGPMS